MFSFADGTNVDPDLVLLPLRDGGEDYVYSDEYRAYCEMDPKESLNKWMILDADGNPVGWGIPAYASDGMTFVGWF